MRRLAITVLVVLVILIQGLLPCNAQVEASPPIQSDWTAATYGSSGGLEPAQSLTEERYEVTLITGDVVIVSIMPDGEKAIAISPASSEANQNFWVMEKPTKMGENTYVIPGNIDLTRFDMELFNVDYLINEKYYELSYLPVLITSKPAAIPAEVMAVESQLTTIAESVDSYPDFATSSARLSLENIANAYNTLTSLSNIEKVWLDRKVRVNLSESVPIIGAPEIWGGGYDGSGIIVAILDTGIDDTHPDLDDLDDNPGTTDPKVLVEANFTNDPTADDGYGHGTHCASIAAGTGAIYTGVAPGAWLYNVKVLNSTGSGDWSWIIAGIEYATLGPDGTEDTGDEADVISMSLGGTGTDGTDPVSLAVDWAVSQGVVVAVSAGNSGDDYFTLGSPGVAREVITVGATDKSDHIAFFSSRGPTIDFRVKPDVVAPGVSIIAARASGTSMGNPINDYYTSAGGTSMAAPHVAGAAALILDANPTIPLGWQAPKFVKDTLMSNAVDLGYNVYTQGAGRIYLPTSVDPKVLVDPVTTSFGVSSGSTIHGQTLTFYNLDSISHEISLTPVLIEINTLTDHSASASLTPSILNIPAGGSATTDLEVNTASLPMGMYSGCVEAIITGGGTNQAIFGFGKMNELVVEKTDMSGNPGVGHYVFAFKDDTDPMFFEAVTDVTGQAILYLADGTYQVGSRSSDTIGQNASVWTFTQVSMPGTALVSLDDRNTVAIDFDPNKEGQVIAEKTSQMYFYGTNYTTWFFGVWRYPATAITYVMPDTPWQSNYTYTYYPQTYYNSSILETPEWAKLRYGLDAVTGPVTFIADYNNLVTRQTSYKTVLQDDEAVLVQWALGPPGYGDVTLLWEAKAPQVRTETLSPNPVSYAGWYEDYDLGQWGFSSTYSISYQPGQAPPLIFGEHPFRSGTGLDLFTDMLRVSGAISTDIMGIRFYNYTRFPAGHLTVEQNGSVVLSTDINDSFSYVIDSPGTPDTTVTLYGISGQLLSTNTYTILNFTADPNTNWRPPILGCRVNSPYVNLYNEVVPGDIPVTILAIDPETGPAGVTAIVAEYSLNDGTSWYPLALTPGAPGQYLATLRILEEKYVSIRMLAMDNLGNSQFHQVIRGFYVTSNWLISPPNGSVSVPGDITFTWEDVPGVTGYHIQIDHVDTFDSPDLIEYDSADNQYTVNLDLGIHYWRVKAYVTGGETTYCTPWQLMVANLMTYLGMKVDMPGYPFSDVRVRLAVYHALDRDSIATSQGRGKVVSIVTPSVPNPNVNPEYNPSLAKQLIAEAGYPNGFIITLTTTPGWVDLANIIRNYLMDVGINVEIVDMEPAAFISELQNGNLGFFLKPALVNVAEPQELLGRLLLSDGAQNFTGYNSPQFDFLFDSGQYQEAENVAFDLSYSGFSVAPLNWNTPYYTIEVRAGVQGTGPLAVHIDWSKNGGMPSNSGAGITPYKIFQAGGEVTLTAPLIHSENSVDYSFKQWLIGVPPAPPDIVTTERIVTFTPDGDKVATAVYQLKANTVDLSIQPPEETVAVGETFSVTIQAEAGTQPVSGISAYLDFDPDYLEVQSVTPGASLPLVIENSFDNTAGTIDFSAGKLGEPFPSGTFDVTMIEFKALALTSPSTAITFSTAFPRETKVDFGGDDVTGTLTGGTVTIADVLVDISMVLQGGGRPDPEGWEIPVTVKFFNTGADVMNDTPIAQFDLTTTKSSGTAVCQCSIEPGDYDITVVSEHTLINVRRNVTISLPSTSVGMGTLLEGNANDDSIINISDFGILAVSFGKTVGQPGYDARADFDRNGIINISDFGLLAVNFMRTSPIEVSGP